MLCKEGKDQESIQSRTTPDLFDISVKKIQLDKNLPIYLSKKQRLIFLSNNACV